MYFETTPFFFHFFFGSGITAWLNLYFNSLGLDHGFKNQIGGKIEFASNSWFNLVLTSYWGFFWTEWVTGSRFNRLVQFLKPWS